MSPLSTVQPIITARKRSLGQGNTFTPVCHFVHRGACMVAQGVCGCSGGRGACMVLFGGHAWFYLGGVCGFIWGACVVLFRGCMVLFGRHAWFYWGVCMVLFGGCTWFYLGGMHDFIWGGVHGFSGGHAWFFWGACMLFPWGGMCGFSRGGMRVFFSFFGYNEIRSMSGRYASYWNAFLFSK